MTWVPLKTMIIWILAWRWLGLIQHNHVHLGLFHQRTPNALLSAILGTMSGISCQLYWFHHVRVHHAGLGSGADWTADSGDGRRTKSAMLRHRAKYVLSFIPKAWHKVPTLLWAAFPSRRRSLMAELLTMLGVWAALLALSPSRVTAAATIFVPVLLTYVFLPWNNLRHHDGCDLESDDPLAYANNDLSRLSTSLGFNIGYHSAHHLRPAVHWSLLGRVHDELEQGSSRARYRDGFFTRHAVPPIEPSSLIAEQSHPLAGRATPSSARHR